MTGFGKKPDLPRPLKSGDPLPNIFDIIDEEIAAIQEAAPEFQMVESEDALRGLREKLEQWADATMSQIQFDRVQAADARRQAQIANNQEALTRMADVISSAVVFVKANPILPDGEDHLLASLERAGKYRQDLLEILQRPKQ